jgi:carboxyl-terminal processing protease
MTSSIGKTPDDRRPARSRTTYWLTALAVAGLATSGLAYHRLRGTQPKRGLEAAFAAAGGGANVRAANEDAPPDAAYRISSLSVFSNVALHVKDNYVDPERIVPKEMLLAALREIERQIAEVLIEELDEGRVKIRVLDKSKTIYIDDVQSLWEINLKLREIFRFFEKYLPPQDDMRSIEYAAVNGALSTLDPHSILLKPDAFAEMKTSTKGEFGGLGIVISVRDAELTIISPLDGTPASRAGLKAGDVIARIGDVSTVSMPIEEAVRMLRGPEGSKVAIWVTRKSWTEARRFTMTRERIKIESVEGRLLSDNVGYIKIKSFQQNTGKDLDTQLAKLEGSAKGKLKGIVMDMRNNPGGLLEQAIRVSDRFLSSGDIVTTVGYGNKLREPKRARWPGTENQLPIVVLVNRGSASASEIVAGALKNLDRAVVMGERTFGKGSVQVLYDFADNSALKLTIAQYLTPGGISIQNEGVTPDVELTPAWIRKEGIRLFYNPQGHRENSLEKHLERSESTQEPAVQPRFSMRYLVDESEEPDEPEEIEDLSQFKEDFQIRLAREYLTSVGSNSRNKMLDAGATFIKSRSSTELGRIATSIQAMGVDWNAEPSPNGGPSKKNASGGLQAKLLIVSKGEKKPYIEAGEDLEMEAVVTNTSDQPLYQVRGVLDTEHPSFRGREFLFGRIDPGKSREWKITTKVPREAASRSDLVTLKLSSEDGDIAAGAVLPVITRFMPHPQFAYHYVIDDEKRGDGDGILEPGEGVELIVLATNTGPGKAEEVTLRLKGPARGDLFLEQGRSTVGVLEPGATRAGRLKFRVLDELNTNEPIPVELTIYDAATGEWLEDRIQLNVHPKRSEGRYAKATAELKAEQSVELYNAASKESGDVIAVADKGTLFKSVGTFGDFYRVVLNDAGTAWVRKSDVRRVRAPLKTSTTGLTFYPARRPPMITLLGDGEPRVVTTDHTNISGTIHGRSLRDMYVLVNDQKVFFASGPARPVPSSEEAKTWQPPDEDRVKLPFRLDLKLKEGLNRVIVVARLDEKIVTYRSLFISRRPKETSAVAAAE